jgi:thiol-disulfide isomerase/thioredoxin
MPGRNNLVRPLAGLALVAVGLMALWAVGALSDPGSTETMDGSGRTVQLDPADLSIETAVPEGFSVGLRAGDVAPDFVFSSFDGERLRLSDFRGQPVWLNFWASWCGPCRAEMPAMELKLREHADDNLVIVAVNNGERIESAERFLERLDIDLGLYAYDPAADVANRYSLVGMPTSFFIDADGVITDVYALALNDAVMESAIGRAIAGYGASN